MLGPARTERQGDKVSEDKSQSLIVELLWARRVIAHFAKEMRERNRSIGGPYEGHGDPALDKLEADGRRLEALVGELGTPAKPESSADTSLNLLPDSTLDDDDGA